MTDPLVSVILPTYNRLRNLPAAIDSVVRQVETRWELIVADDGSTDGTAAYLGALRDPRIRVLHLEHIGHPGEVRSRALDLCRGRYVAFLDSDDSWEPSKLQLQIAALDANPSCGWSYTSFRMIDEGTRAERTVTVAPVSPGGVVEAVVSGAAGLVTSTVMVDRELLLRAGRFEPAVTVGSDLDMWIRVASLSGPAPVPQVLATRHQHTGSYMLAYQDSIEVLERVNTWLLSRVHTPRLRAIIRSRRTGWLIATAGRRHREGRYRDAWAALLAALPDGLSVRGWWRTALRIVKPPVPDAGG